MQAAMSLEIHCPTACKDGEHECVAGEYKHSAAFYLHVLFLHYAEVIKLTFSVLNLQSRSGKQSSCVVMSMSLDF